MKRKTLLGVEEYLCLNLAVKKRSGCCVTEYWSPDDAKVLSIGDRTYSQ